MKILKTIGNAFNKVVGVVTTADKVTRTVSAALKHLKNFDDERRKIWGLPQSEIEVEPLNEQTNE